MKTLKKKNSLDNFFSFSVFVFCVTFDYVVSLFEVGVCEIGIRKDEFYVGL